MNIPLAKPYFSFRTIDSIREVLESGWVTQGPKVKEFEKRYAEYVGSKHAVAVSSGTAALHVSLQALGIEKGDEIIIPDFTFPATGNAVHFTGARPIIADIDPETYCVVPDEIGRKITPKTKAIMPVHCFGHPAEMKVIMEIAEENDLFVIEDAAPAHGAEYDGVKVGTFGKTGCFSFHPRKIISTGEGGMITTDHDEVAKKAKLVRNHGMGNVSDRRGKGLKSPPFSPFSVLGYNYRMSDILAAVGIEQMKTLDKSILRRRELAKLYNELISDSGMDVATPEERAQVKHVYQSYVILLNEQKLRDKVMAALRNMDIGCTIGTYSLSNLPLFDGSCPNGTRAFENTLALPMYDGLKDSDVRHVVNSLKKAFK